MLLNLDPVEQTLAYRLGDFKLVTSDGKMDGWFPTPDAANHNRSVKCKLEHTASVCSGVYRPCLFNIAVDPCEQDDIFSERPDVVKVRKRRKALEENSKSNPLP